MANLCSKCGGDIRTTNTHNHQFAEIDNLFANLPDWHAGAPYARSREAFRKHGLIKTGYCDVDLIDFESKEQACEAAPTIAKLARKAHGYAIVVVRGSQVVCTTPHSQSMNAMGGARFNESKSAVMNWGVQLLESEVA